MDVRFTRHADERMRERGIAPEWVAAALRKPDADAPEPDGGDVRRYFKRSAEYPGKVLRVVARRDGEAFVVITAMFDRKARLSGSAS